MQRYLDRAATALFGSRPVVAAARVHTFHAFADACFTVSLAGSLLLSVSFESARPRIILYLVFTMAPFAIVAPLLGPLVDRVRGGHRAMIAGTLFLRAVICVALAGKLQELVLFPLAFSMLVLDKTYSISRNALIPRLVPGDRLVTTNTRFSQLGTLSGGIGGAIAAWLLVATSARYVPLLGAVVFLCGSAAALSLPRHVPPTGVGTDVAWQELHGRPIIAAQSTMLAMKGANGFLVFLLGVGLKRTGAPTWFFGAAFVAHGVGGLVGNSLAPMLRRRFRESQMLAGSLACAAFVTAIAAIAANRVGTGIAAFGIGANVGVASQAFNATVQRNAPDVDRGRMLAAFDTRFQLAWVLGALIAVVARPELRIGFAGLTALLVVADAEQAFQRARRFVSRRPVETAVSDLGLSARRLYDLGEYRAAALVIVAAADLLDHSNTPADPGVRDELRRLRTRALAGDTTIERADLEQGLRAVGWAVES